MRRVKTGDSDINTGTTVKPSRATERKKDSSTFSVSPSVNSQKEVSEMLFKSWFLSALRDEEIKRTIIQMTAEAVVSVKVQVPEGRVVELERELASKDQSLLEAKDQSQKLAKRLESEEKECEKARARHRASEKLREDAARRCEEAQAELRIAKMELRKLQELSAMADAYERYQAMSASTRKALNGIINGKDLLSFVCTGAQESNLDRFWDLCNQALLDGDVDAASMAKMFDEFFDLSKALGTLTVRERLPVNPGDRFDNDLCTRIAHSAPTGSIKEVLFQGYRYVVSKKIVKKSLVRV